jgi:hypothetical protein
VRCTQVRQLFSGAGLYDAAEMLQLAHGALLLLLPPPPLCLCCRGPQQTRSRRAVTGADTQQTRSDRSRHAADAQ